MTEVPIIQKPANQWTGFYMIRTFIIKKLRNGKPIIFRYYILKFTCWSSFSIVKARGSPPEGLFG